MAIQDFGSNYQFYDKKIKPNVQRSSFQLDYLSTFTANQGLLIPYRIQETLPNSEYNLSLECLSRAINIPKVILQSRQRIFFHEYYMTYQQMWAKWSNFMSKGVSGNSVLALPKILFALNGSEAQYFIRTGQVDGVAYNSSNISDVVGNKLFINRLLNLFGLGYGSLADYLGFPTPQSIIDGVETIIGKLVDNFDTYAGDFKSDIYYCTYTAFPFFAYLSIFRNYYLNWNLNVNNKFFFPDDINDFALLDPDIPASNTFFASTRSAWCYKGVPNTSVGTVSSLASLYFGFIRNRNFVDDYFTASLPWPMRGNIPEISLSGSVRELQMPQSQFKFDTIFSDGSNSSVLGNSIKLDDKLLQRVNPSSNQFVTYGQLTVESEIGSADRTEVSIYTPNLTSGGIDFISGFTWEMIRNLSTATLIAEKMARTNGSYREFIQTFFNDVPSNQINNVPRYIGGSFQPVVYTEVLQTSSDANTPLGTPGAKGIASSDDYIGKVYSNDFGIILGVLSIMPDTYYSQGIRRQHLYEVQEDFYLPERAELGMQGVLKGELYFSGDDVQDNALFGYQNRYDEWRYRANEIHGEIANPANKSYFPYTQSRYFTGAPVLSNAFVSTKNNIRRDYLTSVKEVDFLIQVANKCTAVQPLPYRAIPVGLKD